MGEVYTFQTAGLVIKVYTYSYRSCRYYMRESFKPGAFYQISAAFMREHFPSVFSLIKEELGIRKYMGV